MGMEQKSRSYLAPLHRVLIPLAGLSWGTTGESRTGSRTGRIAGRSAVLLDLRGLRIPDRPGSRAAVKEH